MTAFDITDTLAPTSDQLDAIELVAGPRTFTVDRVTAGNAEQPVQVHFTDFPRPWRPSKGMRRVLAACWGADASLWAGRRVELFRDPSVTFGKDTPGGTRIRALSHIDGQKKVPLLVSRGKSAVFVVEPLPAGPQLITDDQADTFARNILEATTVDQLNTIAADLKACDLGEHRQRLGTAWTARKNEIEQPVQGAIDDQEQAS